MKAHLGGAYHIGQKEKAMKNEIWIVGQDDMLQYIDRKDQPDPYFDCISLQ